MAPFPPDAAVVLQLPASELLRLQESTAFRTLLAQVHLLNSRRPSGKLPMRAEAICACMSLASPAHVRHTCGLCCPLKSSAKTTGGQGNRSHLHALFCTSTEACKRTKKCLNV